MTVQAAERPSTSRRRRSRSRSRSGSSLAARRRRVWRPDRPLWLVPVAATIAAPALWWNVFVILVACVPLLEGRGLTRPLIAAVARATGGGAGSERLEATAARA